MGTCAPRREDAATAATAGRWARRCHRGSWPRSGGRPRDRSGTDVADCPRDRGRACVRRPQLPARQHSGSGFHGRGECVPEHHLHAADLRDRAARRKRTPVRGGARRHDQDPPERRRARAGVPRHLEPRHHRGRARPAVPRVSAELRDEQALLHLLLAAKRQQPAAQRNPHPRALSRERGSERRRRGEPRGLDLAAEAPERLHHRHTEHEPQRRHGRFRERRVPVSRPGRRRLRRRPVQPLAERFLVLRKDAPPRRLRRTRQRLLDSGHQSLPRRRAAPRRDLGEGLPQSVPLQLRSADRRPLGGRRRREQRRRDRPRAGGNCRWTQLRLAEDGRQSLLQPVLGLQRRHPHAPDPRLSAHRRQHRDGRNRLSRRGAALALRRLRLRRLQLGKHLGLPEHHVRRDTDLPRQPGWDRRLRDGSELASRCS